MKLARQPYYRWLAASITDAGWIEAHRANALFDAHRDDPEFGYRFLVDEARQAGQAMVNRTAWRICSANGWWSAFGKKKPYGKARSGGAPAHDDLVARVFTAHAANTLWLTDITEHWTDEGKLYFCAVKDVWFQPDRGLLHRLADEIASGRGRARQRLHPASYRRPRRGRLHPAFRPRLDFDHAPCSAR